MIHKLNIKKKFENCKGVTFLELLVVVAILGIIASIGYPSYSKYQIKAKINAAKENHSNLVSFLTMQSQRCLTGGQIEMAATNSRYVPRNCPSISLFVQYANAHVYGTLKNPYPPSNGSRCRPNVDNCSPPGYLGSCNINGVARYGMMAIIQKSNYEVTVCTNIGPVNDRIQGEILQNTIRYVPNDLKG